MKQMGLKMGPDIMEETKTQDDAGGAKVAKLPPHDDRWAACVSADAFIHSSTLIEMEHQGRARQR